MRGKKKKSGVAGQIDLTLLLRILNTETQCSENTNKFRGFVKLRGAETRTRKQRRKERTTEKKPEESLQHLNSQLTVKCTN